MSSQSPGKPCTFANVKLQRFSTGLQGRTQDFRRGGGGGVPRGGGRDLPKKLTIQTSARLSYNHAHAPIRGQCLGPNSVCFVESSIFTAFV